MNMSACNGISVIIPVYNEKESVEKTLASLHATLGTQKIPYEIIAVNDGSNDGSKEVLEGIMHPKFSSLHHKANRGYGASLKTGIKQAKHEWILITDADGTYPIDRIPDLLAHIDEHDMVVGARKGEKVHDTIPRKIGRHFVRWFASYVSGGAIEDINSGMRIFKKEDALKYWHLFPDGFSFTSTITVAEFSHGKSVKYVPIDYFKRTGSSSIKPARDFVGFLSLVARLALYFRPLKVFVPLALFLFVFAWAVFLFGYFVLHEVLDATWSLLLIMSVQTLIFGFLADMIVKRFYSPEATHEK